MKMIATTLLIASLGLAGCASQVPTPVGNPPTTQPKLLAAQHWQALARDVSQRLRSALAGVEGGGPVVLYVEPSSPTQFGQTFHDLMVTELMQSGFGVTRDPSATNLALSYNVTDAGEADYDVIGPNADITAYDNDIVITFSVTSGDRYVARISEVFYVHEDDVPEYFATGYYVPTRILEVVGP